MGRTLMIVTVGMAAFVEPCRAAEGGMVPYSRRWDVKLTSLDPNEILGKLDLSGPGLERAKAAADRGDRLGALAALLDHYRDKYPLPPVKKGKAKGTLTRAGKIVKHILQWGPYEEADYGPDINWAWDPRGDIEWVAAMYRFYWAGPLADAYAETRDEKYARAFVEMAADWISKHPLEERNKAHAVYKHWKGFAWLDIQTGIRATMTCQAFKTLVHGKAFTPEFLGVLLASLYDHQVKTERIPMGVVHNKAVFEQRGFVNVAYTFREFKDAKRWMVLAVDRMRENLLAQTTSDGVQREWSAGYHLGVLRDAEEVIGRMKSFGLAVPDDYRDRVRKMYDYIFAMATPDLGMPMFGDGSRAINVGSLRSRWSLYGKLLDATESTSDPKHAARAKLDRSALPDQTSYAFREAGFYVMRSEWGPQQVYFALHCSPRAISSHDQADNGTFELYAYGRWLMTDSGFYTYGHDAAGRTWHRQTRVHQTMTLDGKDTKVAGESLLWETSDGLDALVVENRSYPKLTHRRSVWFVDKAFFVLLDEAIGQAKGALDLNFQFAVGDVAVDAAAKSATTKFKDVNVLVWSPSTIPVTLKAEQGWFAWKYGSRERRTAISYRHADPAPAAFLTILYPYRGTTPPKLTAALAEGFTVGADEARIDVTVAGKTWHLSRDINADAAVDSPTGIKTILREHGRRLRYRDEGEGIAVFMAPGAGGTHDVYDPQVRPLVDAGFRVIRFDRVGRGKSDLGRYRYTGASEIADGWAVLDRLGVERAILMGRSAGAALILGMYRWNPERVIGMISIDSSSFGKVYDRPPDTRRPDAPLDSGLSPRHDPEVVAMYHRNKEALRKVGRLWDYPSDYNTKMAVAWAVERERIEEARNALPPMPPEAKVKAPPTDEDPIRVPILIYTAGRGRIGPDDPEAVALGKNLPAEDAKLVVIKNTGHWMNVEVADEFNRELLAFLDRLR